MTLKERQVVCLRSEFGRVRVVVVELVEGVRRRGGSDVSRAGQEKKKGKKKKRLLYNPRGQSLRTSSAPYHEHGDKSKLSLSIASNEYVNTLGSELFRWQQAMMIGH